MFERAAPPLTVAEVLDDPDQAAAWVALDVPGPDTGVSISLLDPGALSHAGRVDLLVALERQAGWLAAMQQHVLAAMAADPAAAADDVDRTGQGWLREDVACALRLSGLTAQRRIAVAQMLAEQLPATLALLGRGEISYLHAASLAEAVYSLDRGQATKVEARGHLRRRPALRRPAARRCTCRPRGRRIA